MCLVTYANTRYSLMSRSTHKSNPDLPPQEGSPLTRLTGRERAVLALISEGKSNKEIAHALFITVHTVKAHISRILHKLAVETRTEAAVLWAIQNAGIDEGRRTKDDKVIIHHRDTEVADNAKTLC